MVMAYPGTRKPHTRITASLPIATFTSIADSSNVFIVVVVARKNYG